jgi:3-dehydroquinate synthase
MEAHSMSQPITVTVDLGSRAYPILVGHDLLPTLGQRLMAHIKQPRAFILTDETVAKLHLRALEDSLNTAQITPHVMTVPAGESTKNWTQLGAVLDWLLGAGAGRDDVLIAFGGGVIGDLTGLAASLMKRGMSLVQVPTTLLAQVDSSVGGKTAVNAAQGKNLIGAFYQPKLVLADTALLQTLPERERLAGYAEVVKYGLIDDPDFFDWLEAQGRAVVDLEPVAIAQAVAKSCQAKARVVAQDEREGGVRALLNLGHTFGHAVEAQNQYRPSVLHGEAVALGMVLALNYSVRIGLTDKAQADRAEKLLIAAGMITKLATMPGGPYDALGLTEAMKQDKKVRAGRVPLILARGIGKSFIHPDADLSDVQSFLAEELSKS